MDWTPSIGSRNSTNLKLTNLLVPLTMLSHNYQNHNYSLMGPCFLQSLLLVIDDNPIKAIINLQELTN
jgi:hypothetical protein